MTNKLLLHEIADFPQVARIAFLNHIRSHCHGFGDTSKVVLTNKDVVHLAGGQVLPVTEHCLMWGNAEYRACYVYDYVSDTLYVLRGSAYVS